MYSGDDKNCVADLTDNDVLVGELLLTLEECERLTSSLETRFIQAERKVRDIQLCLNF